jgi:GT2 family glycosyltransferase/glycosyltransferase involved in cell wall biosynthesis
MGAARERSLEIEQSPQTDTSRFQDENDEVYRLAAEVESLKTELAARAVEIQALSRDLSDTEAELERITTSLGWRLLRRYGPIKYRYLLPVYRLLGFGRVRNNRGRTDQKPGIDGSVNRDGQEAKNRIRINPELPAEGFREALENIGVAGIPRRLDVVCFSIIDWEFRYQRPQQIMSAFASRGHRVFYINTNRFHSSGRNEFSLREIKHNVYEVFLSAKRPPDVYGEVIDRSKRESLLAALDELRCSCRINDAIGYVMIPSWGRVALEARERWGWRIVYDCMDEWESFPNIKPALLAMESKLVEACDLLVVTAQRLYDKWVKCGRPMVLARNAVDYEFYSLRCRPNRLLAEERGPIVGYYGAIAEWFDIELVIAAASARPDYTFVLIGGVFNVDVSRLKALPNVRLLGQQRYEKMPEYLFKFDVCILPFKINQVTEATDPVKLYEYLAAGKPVVAVSLPEITAHRDLIYIAEDKVDFVAQLDQALAEQDPDLMPRRKAFSTQNTWADRYDTIAAGLFATIPRVSVVVVTYNKVEVTRLCIESIIQNTEYPNYEVIVVDNSSTDGTRDYLRVIADTTPNLSVVLNSDNHGFARANNQGISRSTGEYLILLNNDTIVTPGWLSRLVRHLEDPAIGLVGPVTNFAGNEAKIDVTYRTWAEMETFAADYTLRHEGKAADIPMLAMFCLGMRREVYDLVGPLDEQFGIGMFEDDDYSMRVRAAGLRIVCAGDVFVHHFGQAAFKELIKSGDYDPLFDENRRRYEQKWKTRWVPHRNGALRFRLHAKRPDSGPNGKDLVK